MKNEESIENGKLPEWGARAIPPDRDNVNCSEKVVLQNKLLRGSNTSKAVQYF
ncbi:hypothetical protein GCM10027343_36910 [Noviherbaspirillum agri]